MKNKFTLILVLLLATSAMQAQVTIGSNEVPLTGALLMLDDGTRDDDTSVNAKKGLGLPRVELTNIQPETPDELSESIGGSGEWDMDQHIGLVVYNAKEGDVCNRRPVGLYAWNGKQWEGIGIEDIMSPDVSYYKDARDPANVVVYPYRNFGEAGDWMLINMRATKFDTKVTGIQFDETKNPEAPDDFSRTEPRWGYPNLNGKNSNDDSIFKQDKRMGLLYNWIAATGGQNTAKVDQGAGLEGNKNPIEANVLLKGVQGICPNGWHVPSDVEWNILSKELSEYPSKYTTEGIAVPWETDWNYMSGTWDNAQYNGESMKAPCPLPDATGDDVEGKSLYIEQGGFHLVLPGRVDGGRPQQYGGSAYVWTSSFQRELTISDTVWGRLFSRSRTGILRNTLGSSFLSSVRCKRD